MELIYIAQQGQEVSVGNYAQLLHAGANRPRLTVCGIELTFPCMQKMMPECSSWDVPGEVPTWQVSAQ